MKHTKQRKINMKMNSMVLIRMKGNRESMQVVYPEIFYDT